MNSAPSSPQRPLHQAKGAARIFANRLIRVALNLPLTGIERSVKLAPGNLFSERFLLGIPPASWSPALFTQIVTDLHMPPAMEELFLTSMARANFLGLAFEQGKNGCVYKAYLEYPVLTVQDGVPQSAAALQYQGFKWDPECADQHAITHYRWTPHRSAAALEQALVPHLQGLSYPSVRDVVLEVLARAVQRVAATELIYLDVSEAGSTRHSFDLNVYPANLTIADMVQSLELIGRQFGIDALELNGLLSRDCNQTLGHISAGCDRNGLDFLTFYFNN